MKMRLQIDDFDFELDAEKYAIASMLALIGNLLKKESLEKVGKRIWNALEANGGKVIEGVSNDNIS